MSNLLPKSYSYKPKVTTMVMCILLFSLCAVVLGFKAANNDRGLIINGIFTFSQQGASIFFWILTAVSVGFAAIGFMLIAPKATGSLNLELTETELKIPKGFIKKTQTHVIIDDVTEISETEVQGQRILYLHTQRKKFCINRELVPSKESYEEIKEFIMEIVFANNERDTGQSDSV